MPGKIATYEYELIDISVDFGYEIPEEKPVFAYEDGPEDVTSASSQIERDADGIPMGNSKEEIEIRRKIIHDYIQKWRADHVGNPRIYNENLKEEIRINQVFLLESVHHAVANYRSSKAILRMEDVIAKAIYIGDSRKKENDRNQKSFEKMVVLIYKSEILGNVKMTVGVKKSTHEKIEYSITVPPPHTPFIAEDLKIGANSKKRKKHHR